MVFFADSTVNPGPHEYGAAAGGQGQHHDAAARLLGARRAAHGLPDGGARARRYVGVLRQPSPACTGSSSAPPARATRARATQERPDGGSDSSCEGLLVSEPSTNQVTVLMVDNQYLYVGTADGVLTRYDALDGTNPLQLSTAGPFYGLTQDVDTDTAAVTFGTVIYATSIKGPDPRDRQGRHPLDDARDLHAGAHRHCRGQRHRLLGRERRHRSDDPLRDRQRPVDARPAQVDGTGRTGRQPRRSEAVATATWRAFCASAGRGASPRGCRGDRSARRAG